MMSVLAAKGLELSGLMSDIPEDRAAEGYYDGLS